MLVLLIQLDDFLLDSKPNYKFHSPYQCKDSRQAWREAATTSHCQLRMSSEISSTLRASGALASRSRLVKGQRREGSRERLELSLVRQSLRCFRR